MQKILRVVGNTALALIFGAQFALAQNPVESAAGVPDETVLKDSPIEKLITEPIEKPIEKPTEAPVQVFQKTFKNPLMAKQAAKINKFFHSKAGKWVLKRSLAKADRKAIRQAKKNPDMAKKAPDELKHSKKLSGNLRIAAILGIIGIILTLIPWGNNFGLLNYIGVILIVIALIFILLEII